MIHNLSCLDGYHGLPSLEDDSVHVCITDPPYEAEAHTQQRRICAGRHLDELDADRATKATPLSFSSISNDERRTVAAEIARVTRRWILVFCQVEAVHAWRDALEQGGARYVRTMVWVKPDAQPQLSGDRPGMGYESIVVAYGSPGRMRWNGGGRRGVFQHTRHPAPAPHSTTKPLPLMRELVDLFSDPGELVIDPYAGSGTTGVACRQLGRLFVGWEIDSDHAAIAERRIRGENASPDPRQPELF